jgi:adenine phosphoribosyltransferase
MDIKSLIREVPDFPKAGISYKDITTLLKNGPALNKAVKMMAEPFRNAGIDQVVGVESRGFIFGSAIACELGVGLILIRKPGKLPAEKIQIDYALEYGTDSLEMHVDALSKKDRVILVDDLLATGGTIKAAADLVEKLGAEVVGYSFLIELAFLQGRKRLNSENVHSLVSYDE